MGRTIGGLNRREVGHGMLAEKALFPSLSLQLLSDRAGADRTTSSFNEDVIATIREEEQHSVAQDSSLPVFPYSIRAESMITESCGSSR